MWAASKGVMAPEELEFEPEPRWYKAVPPGEPVAPAVFPAPTLKRRAEGESSPRKEARKVDGVWCVEAPSSPEEEVVETHNPFAVLSEEEVDIPDTDMKAAQETEAATARAAAAEAEAAAEAARRVAEEMAAAEQTAAEQAAAEQAAAEVKEAEQAAAAAAEAASLEAAAQKAAAKEAKEAAAKAKKEEAAKAKAEAAAAKAETAKAKAEAAAATKQGATRAPLAEAKDNAPTPVARRTRNAKTFLSKTFNDVRSARGLEPTPCAHRRSPASPAARTRPPMHAQVVAAVSPHLEKMRSKTEGLLHEAKEAKQGLFNEAPKPAVAAAPTRSSRLRPH